MNIFLLCHVSRQPEPLVPREGLPYWTFWFLLCVILLLITFIFLRDKSLRQRLNLFFSRAKRRMVKIRLQNRLKREIQKKEDMFKELGKETWKERIKIQQSESVINELNKLEHQSQASQGEFKNLEAKIEMLNKQLVENYEKHQAQIKEKEAEMKPFKEDLAELKEKEKLKEVMLIAKQKEIEETEKILETTAKEAKQIDDDPRLSAEEKKNRKKEVQNRRKASEKKKEKAQRDLKSLREEKAGFEKEIAKLQGKINNFEGQIKKIEKNKKEQTRKFQKEIKEWEKNKDKTEKKITEIEKQKEPLFANLGKIMDEFRVDHNKLTLFYSKIDRANKRIKDIERDIHNL